MVEKTPFLDLFTQIVLLMALIVALAPFAIVAIAASHDLRTVNEIPMPLLPGHEFLNNLREAWNRADFGPKLVNSLIFAIGVAAGKVSVSAISAFSIVFFTYRGRRLFFWLTFMTRCCPWKCASSRPMPLLLTSCIPIRR
jgi:sn-glycerol 3-phosphate transport system permease protein